MRIRVPVVYASVFRVLACVSLVAACNAGVCLIALAQAAPAPAPTDVPKVSVAMPKQKEVKQTLKLPGNLVPDEQVVLYSKIAGYLDEIYVDRGDRVTKDQVLAKLSAPEMEPELALAEAKVRAAQSRLGKAEASIELESATHKRLAGLRAAEPGAVSEEDVEIAAAKDKTARAELATVDAELGVAKAEVGRIKTMLDYLTVCAPFDGTVTQRFADPGAFIAAGTGSAKPIVEITRVQKLRLVFDLPERLTPVVNTGHSVQYSVAALPGKMFEGAVARRTGTLDANTRTMRAEVDVDNSDGRLSPGMYASVQIPLRNMPGISVLPATALRTIDGKVCVLTVVDGAARKLPVEALLDDGLEVVVAGELSEETPIIIKGPATLADSQRVEVVSGV